MRAYQHVGLTEGAHRFLNENTKKVPSVVCPKCGEVISERMDSEVYGTEDAFYGDGPTLHEYKLKDGRKAIEMVQAMPYSSGPMGFICLEIDGERIFEWTDEEIRSC